MMNDPTTSSSSRGRLLVGIPRDELPDTRAERRAARRPPPAGRDEEPPTITAGGIKRTIQDAAKPLSLDERFVDHGEIARGGMATIHEAYERSIGRMVAIKVLSKERAENVRTRDRFLAEAQITGQLEHPNIVPVHEVGRDDEGNYYFTMRLIEGRTFTEFLEDGEGLEGQQAEEHLEACLEVFFRACDALSFAHSRGVLHRDVKPSNIMVGTHGQVYLMDWGIASVSEKVATDAAASMEGQALDAEPKKATTTLTTLKIDDTGLVVGTYAYMSPEQARGHHEEMDARTDVFGMGAVLFRIVTRRPPFLGQNAFAVLEMAAHCEVPDLEEKVPGRLGKELLRVARQALQAAKEDRFQTVAALKSAVQGVLRGRQRFPSRTFSAGELILQEGAVGDDAFFIRRGECRVFRVTDGEKRELLTLREGDVFGETAVFTGEPRNASVEAATEVDLTVVPGRALTEALGLDTWMGAFVRSLGERFTERSHRVTTLDAALARSRLVNRVLAYFLDAGVTSAAVPELASRLKADPVLLLEAAEGAERLEVVSGEVRLRAP